MGTAKAIASLTPFSHQERITAMGWRGHSREHADHVIVSDSEVLLGRPRRLPGLDRYWHLATAREVAIPVAIGGKADIAVCDQKRR